MATKNINTFNRGMDLDTNLLSVSKDSYIYGENVRIVVDNSSNNGVLHAVEGLKSLNNSSIQYKYYQYDENNDRVLELYSTFDSDRFDIIGIAVIRNYICLITIDRFENEINCIFRLKLDNDIIDLTMIASGEFNIVGDRNNQLSITTKWEDFDNIKVYWADGVNPLRSINIAELEDLNNYNKEPSFFNSTLSIAINKPEFVSFISGNLKAGMVQYAYQMFNKNGSETVISPLSDLIHLTKSNAFDVNYQGSTKDDNTTKSCKIKFEVTNDNFSRCKLYRIHFSDAATTPKVYLVSDFNIAPTLEGSKQFQYFSDNGSIVDELTYEEFLSSSPYYFIPKVIESKDNILFAANIIEDTWSLPDYTSNDWYDTRAFRFATNTTDGVHARVDSLNNDTKIIKYEHLTNYSAEDWKAFVPYDHDCINPVNTNFSSSLKRDTSSYEWYWDNTTFKQKGGVGRNVSFKIVHTRFGNDFYETFTGTRNAYLTRKRDLYNGHARLVNMKNGGVFNDNGLPMNYNLLGTDQASYETADYYNNESVNFKELGVANYSNPYLDAKYRSYQRDEIYRFGVVFYNKQGQTTPVSWIADIRMPSMLEKEHRLFDQWERIKVNRSMDEHNVYQVVTYPMGLQFEFKNLPQDVYQIEIVRCERTRSDRRILAQGLISRTGAAGNNINEKDNTSVRPLITMNYNSGFRQYFTAGNADDDPDDAAIVNTNPIDYTTVMNNSKDTFTFISPEISYFKDSISGVVNNVTDYGILYGLSSPTFVEDPYTTMPGTNEVQIKDIARNVGVKVYNSQIWFNGELTTSGASGDYQLEEFRRIMMDGNVGKYKTGIRTLYTRGYSGKGSASFTNNEVRSKYVAKMYNPFTYYSGDSSQFDIALNKPLIRIEDIKYASGLNYDQYEDVVQGSHKISVGSKSYQNWVLDKNILPNNAGYKTKFKHGAFSPTFVYKSSETSNVIPTINAIGTANNPSKTIYSNYFGLENFNIPTTTANGEFYSIYNEYDKAVSYVINSTFLVNLYQNSTFYGGLDYGSRTSSTYVSTFSATPIDSSSNVNLTVFSGDTYIGITEQVQQHWYYLASDPEPANRDSWNKRGEKAQIVLYYPCESTINHSMVNGSSFYRYANDLPDTPNQYIGSGVEFPYDLQLEPGVRLSNFAQDKPLYAYNSVYSTASLSTIFLPKGVYNEDNKNYDYRVVYSEMKTNDEISDSWLKFKPANYLDVDTRFGSINNLKLFNNNLYYWQDNSFGLLSVNQRSLIQDNNIGTLVLGKGDVLSRYDHISTSNGSRKNVVNNVAITPSTMFWYDHERGEILSFSNELTPLTKVKNVQSFFNVNKDNITNDVDTLYDKKYNEVHFMFNMNDESYKHLIYNERVDGFTSFYTYNPDWFIDLKKDYYTLKGNNIYKLNEGDYNKFYNGVDNTIIKTVVNDNPKYTKVFDNVEMTGDIELNSSFRVDFTTNKQESSSILETDVRLREDNYRFVVAKDNQTIATDSVLFPTHNDRMRGKYLVTLFNFKPLNNNLNIPYIETTYRISNI